jgi:hypothetical protein
MPRLTRHICQNWLSPASRPVSQGSEQTRCSACWQNRATAADVVRLAWGFAATRKATAGVRAADACQAHHRGAQQGPGRYVEFLRTGRLLQPRNDWPASLAREMCSVYKGRGALYKWPDCGHALLAHAVLRCNGERVYIITKSCSELRSPDAVTRGLLRGRIVQAFADVARWGAGRGKAVGRSRWWSMPSRDFAHILQARRSEYRFSFNVPISDPDDAVRV